MSFTIFTEGTRIDPSEVNENFYHISQGDIMPLSGNSMGMTNNSLDLGSSTYRWKNVNVEVLNKDIQNIYKILYQTTTTDASNKIEISGLNGEVDNLYQVEIIYKQAVDNLNVFLSINGDTTQSYTQRRVTIDSSISHFKWEILKGFFIQGINASTTSGLETSIKLEIYPAISGVYKSFLNRSFDSQSIGLPLASSYVSSGIYRNTDTITSMVLHFDTTTSNFATGTSIRLIGRS